MSNSLKVLATGLFQKFAAWSSDKFVRNRVKAKSWATDLSRKNQWKKVRDLFIGNLSKALHSFCSEGTEHAIKIMPKRFKQMC